MKVPSFGRSASHLAFLPWNPFSLKVEEMDQTTTSFADDDQCREDTALGSAPARLSRQPHQWPAAAPIDRPRVTPATPRHAATPAVPNIWVSHRAGGPPPGTRLTALTWHGAAGGCAWLCVRRREGGPRCSVLYCRLSSPHGPTERGGKGVVLVKPSPAVAANPGAARRADTAVQSHRTPAHTIRCHGPGFPLSSERSPAGSASR